MNFYVAYLWAFFIDLLDPGAGMAGIQIYFQSLIFVSASR